MSKTLLPATATIAFGALLSAPAWSAELALNVEIPKLDVAEYHRPYVAIWVEGADHKDVADLAVWYQLRDPAEGHGTQWLPDLRQWWRKSGRNLQVPVDGITGPTRPAGLHTLKFADRQPQLARLAAGNYTLVVEAVREVGGRELLKIPFTWPAKQATTAKAKGSSELGTVSLTAKP